MGTDWCEEAALDSASKLARRHTYQGGLVGRDRPALTCRDVHQTEDGISHEDQPSSGVRASVPVVVPGNGRQTVCVSRTTGCESFV